MINELSGVLRAAVDEGFLTAAAASEGVNHSEGFLRLDGRQPPITLAKADLAVDLGTGGGLPGIVLAARTTARWILVERSQRRSRFLEWAVRKLDIGSRVEVANADASDLARSDCRGLATLVTARSFRPPAITAEIAVALLKVGGTLVISEPPSGAKNDTMDRWSPVGITQLGLVDAGSWHNGKFGYKALSCTRLAPESFPRRERAMITDPVF